MNLQILQLMNYIGKHIPSIELKDEQLLKFRTYFLRKALGASSLKEYSVSLRGISLLNAYPFLKLADGNSNVIKIGDGKPSPLKFELVDMLGLPISSGVKNIKVSLVAPQN